MKAIIIGGDGTVGRALAQTLRQRGDVVFSTTRRSAQVSEKRPFLDLASDIDRVRLPSADIAFFCAAVVSFAECRTNAALARRVNAVAPAKLAERFVAAGARVVMLSTSAVYDWQTPLVPAERKPCPVTRYGEFAAEAESAFGQLGSAASILRLTKLLTPELNLFVGWIDKLSLGQEIVAYSDLHISPIAIEDVMVALLAIAEEDTSGGIFQVSGAGDISYHEAAEHLAARLGADRRLVVERHAVEAGIPPEEVPRFASLDSTRLARLTNWRAPDPYKVLDLVYGRSIEKTRKQTAL